MTEKRKLTRQERWRKHHKQAHKRSGALSLKAGMKNLASVTVI